MGRKKITPFNVINYNFNSKKFESYDIMPYFINTYKKIKRKKTCPKTFEEFKKFVETNSMYMFWARCEYEIVLQDWPCMKINEKIDIHWQIKMNIDLITKILMENVIK